MDSKLICLVGAPSSGKSTLASDIHTTLKKNGENSIFVPEASTDFIAEYGVPDSPLDQMVIFYKQLNRERMYLGSKEFVVCDSSTLLNYFYFRSLFPKKLTHKDIATINHLQKEILKTINHWSHIFYVPPFLQNTQDGIRFHNPEQIVHLDRCIKSYLDIENIQYTDLSNVDLKDRVQTVLTLI